mmetsp:Transcript_52137/g.153893  ORF Transcript_52137/g.153893 Transcript_52137/m.153893 type:complete len:237 (+) Transcript_52137:212-922(+)
MARYSACAPSSPTLLRVRFRSTSLISIFFSSAVASSSAPGSPTLLLVSTSVIFTLVRCSVRANARAPTSPITLSSKYRVFIDLWPIIALARARAPSSPTSFDSMSSKFMQSTCSIRRASCFAPRSPMKLKRRIASSTRALLSSSASTRISTPRSCSCTSEVTPLDAPSPFIPPMLMYCSLGHLDKLPSKLLSARSDTACVLLSLKSLIAAAPGNSSIACFSFMRSASDTERIFSST